MMDLEVVAVVVQVAPVAAADLFFVDAKVARFRALARQKLTTRMQSYYSALFPNVVKLFLAASRLFQPKSNGNWQLRLNGRGNLLCCPTC